SDLRSGQTPAMHTDLRWPPHRTRRPERPVRGSSTSKPGWLLRTLLDRLSRGDAARTGGSEGRSRGTIGLARLAREERDDMHAAPRRAQVSERPPDRPRSLANLPPTTCLVGPAPRRPPRSA